MEGGAEELAVSAKDAIEGDLKDTVNHGLEK